jgi:hypothetical protein
MSTPWANQREGCLQRTTHDGRAGCMQFLPCYPRISPTVNTVGDKKSVTVTDSTAHQIEACMGPQSGLFAQMDLLLTLVGVALLPPEESHGALIFYISTIFPPSPHAHAAAHSARAIVSKKVVTQRGVGAPGEKPLEPVGVQLAQNLSCMNESRGSRSDIRTVFFRSTLCSQ